MHRFSPSLAIGIALMVAPVLSAQSPSQTRPQTSLKTSSLVYTNRPFGFQFDLPLSWKGYTILKQQWSGRPDTAASSPHREHGPKLVLRHPHWTTAHPHQDIPIMIFTLRQWNENLIVSAAPIGPSELGRNSRYVFALPPRYNYAFPDGYEEVEQILKDKPLHPF